MYSLDEILYHSRIHPERRCNTLSGDELAALHHQTQHVCQVAVEANADDTKFPEDWLFKHRWVRGTSMVCFHVCTYIDDCVLACREKERSRSIRYCW